MQSTSLRYLCYTTISMVPIKLKRRKFKFLGVFCQSSQWQQRQFISSVSTILTKFKFLIQLAIFWKTSFKGRKYQFKNRLLFDKCWINLLYPNLYGLPSFCRKTFGRQAFGWQNACSDHSNVITIDKWLVTCMPEKKLASCLNEHSILCYASDYSKINRSW